MALSKLASEYRPGERRIIILLAQTLCLMMNQAKGKEAPVVELHQLAPDIWKPPTAAEIAVANDAKMKMDLYKEFATNLRVQ